MQKFRNKSVRKQKYRNTGVHNYKRTVTREYKNTGNRNKEEHKDTIAQDTGSRNPELQEHWTTGTQD
jgi:hypothetical protein